ncbi:hypothetical protein L6164_002002 [Bauhinia variegata]|uniref:Uncharacterized protein n=1 Tax=Bauhinia variegata TaxID=167791 RepID=A0ACB9PW10_BAUVA|nr:hypothetical protein L6164_002002 [Bauhinia variegata]
MIDVVVDGTLNNKTPRAVEALTEEMAINSYQQSSTKAKVAKSTRSYLVDSISALSLQVEALDTKIGGLKLGQQFVLVVQCDSCRGAQPNHECQATIEEHSNFVGNRQTYNPYSNTYNLGWWNHPNFS